MFRQSDMNWRGSRRAAIIELMHRAGVVYYPCLACLVFGLTLRAESCGDIAKVDFRNHVIVAAHYSTEPDYRMSNGPGPGGPLRLHHGVFLQWDLPPSEIARLSAEERDEIMRNPIGGLRLNEICFRIQSDPLVFVY